MKQLYKVVKALSDLQPVEHKKPEYPTNKNLSRKFVIRIKNGNPVMVEVD